MSSTSNQNPEDAVNEKDGATRAGRQRVWCAFEVKTASTDETRRLNRSGGSKLVKVSMVTTLNDGLLFASKRGPGETTTQTAIGPKHPNTYVFGTNHSL